MRECSTCVCRLLCTSCGESCSRHDDEELFWLMLKMHFPGHKIDAMKKASQEIRGVKERRV